MPPKHATHKKPSAADADAMASNEAFEAGDRVLAMRLAYLGRAALPKPAARPPVAGGHVPHPPAPRPFAPPRPPPGPVPVEQPLPAIVQRPATPQPAPAPPVPDPLRLPGLPGLPGLPVVSQQPVPAQPAPSPPADLHLPALPASSRQPSPPPPAHVVPALPAVTQHPQPPPSPPPALVRRRLPIGGVLDPHDPAPERDPSLGPEPMFLGGPRHDLSHVPVRVPRPPAPRRPVRPIPEETPDVAPAISSGTALRAAAELQLPGFLRPGNSASEELRRAHAYDQEDLAHLSHAAGQASAAASKSETASSVAGKLGSVLNLAFPPAGLAASAVAMGTSANAARLHHHAAEALEVPLKYAEDGSALKQQQAVHNAKFRSNVAATAGATPVVGVVATPAVIATKAMEVRAQAEALQNTSPESLARARRSMANEAAEEDGTFAPW